MKVSMLDIILYGGYGLGNLGDDALMVAFYKFLRTSLPEARIGITTVNQIGKEYINKLAPGSIILMRNPREEIFTTCNILVYGGGTQWYSFPGIREAEVSNPNFLDKLLKKITILKDLSRKAILQFYQSLIKGDDSKYLILKKPPKRFSSIQIKAKKYLASGIGLGPFLAGGEEVALGAIEKCEYVGVRDPISFEYCQHWGISDVKLRADICYLGDLYGLKPERKINILKGNTCGQQRLGVIVRDWPHTAEGRSYYNSLQTAVDALRERNFHVSYIVFSQLREKYWLNYFNDKNEVYNIWQPNLNHNISEFIEGLLNYDIIISSRYHGIVFSAVQGIPSIAIEIEPKLKIAAQTLQPGCLLWKQPFDATELLSHITTILNDYQARTDAILLSVEIQKHLGKLMLEEIEQFAFQNCNDLD